jgi:hypothetical protein
MVDLERCVVDGEELPAAAALTGLGIVLVRRGERRKAVGRAHQMGRRATVSKNSMTRQTVMSKPEMSVPRRMVCTA